MPAPIGGTVGFVSGVGQATSVNGSISGKLPAAENSDALAQNRPLTGSRRKRTLAICFLPPPKILFRLAFTVCKTFSRTTPCRLKPRRFCSRSKCNKTAVPFPLWTRTARFTSALATRNATAGNEPVPTESAAAPAAPPQSQTQAAQLAGNRQQAAQNYFFRVAGMNRTLKQNVVFTGNLLANSGMPQPAQTSNSFGGVGGGGGGGEANSRRLRRISCSNQCCRIPELSERQ